MNVGDRFTLEVGDTLIEAIKDDIKVVVNRPEEAK